MMVVEIKGIWYTLEENKPNSNEEILIATTDGTVTFATFYEEDEVFMNEFDQEWGIAEVEFWTETPKHPRGC